MLPTIDLLQCSAGIFSPGNKSVIQKGKIMEAVGGSLYSEAFDNEKGMLLNWYSWIVLPRPIKKYKNL